MLSLAPAHTHLAEEAIRHPGGFAWWYLDLVDAQGDGLVLIWSFGLPFLPGIRAVRGPPLARPSLALSIYKGGRERFYLFQELPPEEVDWRPESGYGMFGNSLIALRCDAEEAGVSVALDLEVPKSQRLQGRIRVSGPVRVGGDDAAIGSPHVWAPMLGAARGMARLDGAYRLNLDGRAYLDHNASLEPLHALGIARWTWGRVALTGRELVWYHLHGQRGVADSARVLEIQEDGSARRSESPVLLAEPRRSWSGLSWHQRVRFQDPDGREVAVTVGRPVDNAPFYQRFLVNAEAGGEAGVGVAEQVAPPLLDRLWMRPFVRMRVHRLRGWNSLWLPLFTGAAGGRARRLLSLERLRLPGADRG